MFEWVVGLAAIAGGALASVAGFGIGSLITPVIASQLGTKVAVALVSIPHFIGTALRFAMLRGHVDRSVLLGFGITSAAGGLTGALLHSRLGHPSLSLIFGALLLFVAFSEFSGLSKRLRFDGAAAWIAGALSGVLGGLVGNQGGIRAGALVGIHLRRDAFVATATATGLLVDLARMPVYFVTMRDEVARYWPLAGLTTVGVVIGTLAGRRLLARIPEDRFHRMVAIMLAVLGASMIATSSQ
jgi:uncharacterized membrane protein YfcA